MSDGTTHAARAVAELFAHSSHATRWLYGDRAALDAAYAAVNARAGLPLTAAETAACACEWSARAFGEAQRLGLALPVGATAALFVQRFLTRVPFTAEKPPALAAAAVLLATKAQEGFTYRMPLDRLVGALAATARVGDADLAALEARLLQTLAFDVRVYLAGDATDRLTGDFVRGTALAPAPAAALARAAQPVLLRALCSTVVLLHTPAQVAAAVLGAAAASLAASSAEDAGLPARLAAWLDGAVAAQPGADAAAVRAAVDDAQRALAAELADAGAQAALYQSALAKCKQYKQSHAARAPAAAPAAPVS